MRKFINSKEFSDNEIGIHVQHMAFKYESIHTHEFYEFVYMIKGEMHNKINDKSYLMTPGCLALVDTGQTHEIIAISDQVAYINILVSNDFINQFAKNSDNILNLFSFISLQSVNQTSDNVVSVMQFFNEDKVRVDTLVNSMLFEFNEKKPYYTKILSNYFYVLMLEIKRHLDLKKDNEVQGKLDSQLSIVLEFIEENFVQKLNLKDIASKFFYNSSYFSRMFKKVMGITFKDYLQTIRVKQAIKFLNETDYSISEIAVMVGYDDKKQFYNVFKKIEGITPGEYRRNLLNKTK